VAEKSQDQLPYVDRPDLSEVFADGIRSIQWDGHSFRIEFSVNRQIAKTVAIPPKAAEYEISVYPCARIVLTPGAAVNLQDMLVKTLNVLESQGVLKRVAPTSGTKQ